MSPALAPLAALHGRRPQDEHRMAGLRSRWSTPPKIAVGPSNNNDPCRRKIAGRAEEAHRPTYANTKRGRSSSTALELPGAVEALVNLLGSGK